MFNNSGSYLYQMPEHLKLLTSNTEIMFQQKERNIGGSKNVNGLKCLEN